MSVKKFIGRESHFHGKTLFEIARNLKSFGVGRMVMRTKFNKQYDGIHYYRLTHVRPDMNSKYYLQGEARGIKVFRGVNMGERGIQAGQKRDWILVPKDEEHLICNVKTVDLVDAPRKVIPALERIPPLMEIILKFEMKAKGMKIKDKDFYADRIVNHGSRVKIETINL